MRKYCNIITIILMFLFLITFVSATTPTCTDTDGQTLTTKGTVSGIYQNGASYSFKDICSVQYPNKVSEGFCIGTDPASAWQTCPSGNNCVDGACISSSTTCSSQGGSCRDLCFNDEGSIGILNCNGGNLCCKRGVQVQTCPSGTTTYHCEGFDMTKKFICDASTGISQSQQCGANQLCSNGQCVKSTTGSVTPTCTDTDGTSVSTKGTVSGNDENGHSYFINDYCSIEDSSKVSEQICSGSSPSSIWSNCPTNTKCANGKCVASSTTCASIQGSCKDFCAVGEIAGGKLDCTNNFDCCVKGTITNCPAGTEQPRCTADPRKYLVCSGGVTHEIQCKGDATCSQGIACYGLGSYTATGSFLDSLGTSLHNVIDPILGINQTQCNTCTDWLLNKVGVKQCNAGFLSNITFGLIGVGGISCTTSLIKWIILILVTII